jgi:hypothetical protein
LPAFDDEMSQDAFVTGPGALVKPLAIYRRPFSVRNRQLRDVTIRLGVTMTTPAEALDALDFGRVDAESEPDLDRRFLRTGDFDKFLQPRYSLIVGAKGSGKSALFEMFTDHLPSARKLAGAAMSRVLASIRQ